MKPEHKFLVELNHEEVIFLCAILIGASTDDAAIQWIYATVMGNMTRSSPSLERDLLKKLAEAHNQMHETAGKL